MLTLSTLFFWAGSSTEPNSDPRHRQAPHQTQHHQRRRRRQLAYNETENIPPPRPGRDNYLIVVEDDEIVVADACEAAATLKDFPE